METVGPYRDPITYPPYFPMPNDMVKLEHKHPYHVWRMCIASTWYRDDIEHQIATFIVMEDRPPFYRLINAELVNSANHSIGGIYHDERFDNINQVVEAYKQWGGEL